MDLLETILVDLGVLILSGGSAVVLGHLFLRVVVKSRRSS
jgi:hypothetical protein